MEGEGLPWLECSSSVARSDDGVGHFLHVSTCSLLEVRTRKSLQLRTAARYEDLSMGFQCSSLLLDTPLWECPFRPHSFPQHPDD